MEKLNWKAKYRETHREQDGRYWEGYLGLDVLNAKEKGLMDMDNNIVVLAGSKEYKVVKC